MRGVRVASFEYYPNKNRYLFPFPSSSFSSRNQFGPSLSSPKRSSFIPEIQMFQWVFSTDGWHVYSAIYTDESLQTIAKVGGILWGIFGTRTFHEF
jgi:CRISPR/Cas system CSM-associated protein Csm4 (group 5 of RAMP superfamily)